VIFDFSKDLVVAIAAGHFSRRDPFAL
jgi:hypothetical protein